MTPSALHAATLPMARLFDGVPDIVFFVKDAKGRYLSVNDTLAKRCGLATKDEVIGRTAEELFPPPLGTAFAGQDRALLEGGPAIRDHLEIHLYPGGGSGWCLTYKQPVPAPDGSIIGICGISRDLQQPMEGCEDYAALSGCIGHIHKHFDEPLRLPELAAMAGMSVYQLDRRIRALFRLSAGQYLVKVRIDAACGKLRDSAQAIAQIALDCGYSDQSAFSRQFRQTVGMPPLAYRRKFRG
jgi:PAS domain S-box-containing protein